MKTKAIRLYGKNDLRMEQFDLPEIKPDEILAKVVCDSICMSSYKAAHQGEDHKRVPHDINDNPIIIGHEFAGEIIEVGKKWEDRFHAGDKFSIQPAINYPDGPVGLLSAPGYSYAYIGGDATYIVIPNEVMERNCLLNYAGEGFYPASLAEPFSCVIGAMNANYHTSPGSYVHEMDIKRDGNVALLAGAGPMGLAALNYALNRGDRRPKRIVVTDIDDARLFRAESLFNVKDAERNGIELFYLNTGKINPTKELLAITAGEGYDDVFVFAPSQQLIEQADRIIAPDGCINFFAGPSDENFRAPINFYKIHYENIHITGTSGGNKHDMLKALQLMNLGLDPAGLVTHIGGLNAVIDATLNLPAIPGGKKLIYTHVNMPLTPISELSRQGKNNPLFAELGRLCDGNNGLWNVEAEEYLLKNV